MVATPERRAVVLVVTGSDTLVEDLRRLLDAATFEVRDAGSRPDGPPSTGGPDVVIADLERVPSLDPAPGRPLTLALVRRSAPDDVERAREAGAVDVLALPLAAAEVAVRVGAVLRLSRAEARITTRDRDLAAWAERAGHDLKSPLAVISGMAETLETAWDRLPAVDRDRFLGAIGNQAARATALVDAAIAQSRRGGPAPIGWDPPHP